MKDHEAETKGYVSIWSHFTHIFISSLASSFYLVSHGFHNWSSDRFCIFSINYCVVVPCTLSDIVVPMYVCIRKNEKN